MLALDRPEVAYPAADVGTGIFRDVGGKLPLFRERKSGVPHRLGGCGDGVMNKGAHLARLFFCNVLEWVEVLNFGCELYRKLFGVKLLDVVDATAPTHQCGPGFLNRVTNRSYQTQACNNYTSFQSQCSLKP